MLKWLFICDGCGVDAPVPMLDRLPRGWLHRTIRDVAIGVEGESSLERNQHFCPACKCKHVVEAAA